MSKTTLGDLHEHQTVRVLLFSGAVLEGVVYPSVERSVSQWCLREIKNNPAIKHMSLDGLIPFIKDIQIISGE